MGTMTWRAANFDIAIQMVRTWGKLLSTKAILRRL